MQKLGSRLSAWAEKYMPDPFVFALLLTMLTFGLGLLLTPHNPQDMLLFWYQGIFKSKGLMAFGMKMCLILVTGYALATTSLSQSIIKKLAAIPQSTQGAAWMVALVAVISGYINWGFAVVVGALLAREVAVQAEDRGIRLHYPLLGAAGYMGLAVWHGGFSGSALLDVARPNHTLINSIGVIPLEATIQHPLNLTVAGVMIVILPMLFWWMAPTAPDQIRTIKDLIPDYKPEVNETTSTEVTGLGQWLNQSFLVTLIICGGGAVFFVQHFYLRQKGLNLDSIIFLFLLVGLLLHRTPKNYVQAIEDGTKGCSGIILQFPFYFGIMGMMKASGLGTMMVEGIISISSSTTYPVFTFISAGLVNLFVPSGGGQWAIQGPIVVQAAQQLDVPISKALLAFAYGDQWTNLLQPFWALALLGITGLKASQIMGYCITVMLVGIAFFTGVLLIF